jgi:YbgC/YbaW family acyl-CoA thioester hydrolase
MSGVRSESILVKIESPMGAFIIEQRVAWSDVDLAGIVYFPRYFTYFENAELEWFRRQGLTYEGFLEEIGVWMPRVACHSNFRAPAKLAELLSIEMCLDRLGRTSFTFGFDAFRLPERTPIADGYIVVATVERETFRPAPVPERLVKLLSTLERRPAAKRTASPAIAGRASASARSASAGPRRSPEGVGRSNQ